jgi:hypothetical protein
MLDDGLVEREKADDHELAESIEPFQEIVQ